MAAETFTVYPSSTFGLYWLKYTHDGIDLQIEQTCEKTAKSIEKLIGQGFKWSHFSSPQTVLGENHIRFAFRPSLTQAYTWGSIYSTFAAALSLPAGDLKNNEVQISFITVKEKEAFIQQFNQSCVYQIKE